MLIISNHLRNIIIFLVIICSNNVFALQSQISLDQALADEQSNIERNTDLLSQPPEKSATVGVVLIHKDKKPQLFLARERIDGDNPKKAGTFSDLGGKVDGCSKDSLLLHMLKVLRDESIDSLNITQADFLRKAYIIYKNNNGHDVVYGIYPVNDEEFNITKDLNHKRRKSNNLSPEFIEKDLFLWLDSGELLAENAINNDGKVKVKDIDENIQNITIRKYFIDDFLTHPDLAIIIKKFSQ